VALIDPPPASVEGGVCAVIPRDVVADPRRWPAALTELETAARAALAVTLGREPGPARFSVGVLYGCLSDPGGTFRPFPCPEATHARVSVRLVEETR